MGNKNDRNSREPWFSGTFSLLPKSENPEEDSLPAWSLCQLYDKWNKPEKAEPQYRRMLTILEKQYGSENPFLLSALTGEAKALHQLGRSEEASKVEERMKSIQAATGQTEGAGLIPQR